MTIISCWTRHADFKLGPRKKVELDLLGEIIITSAGVMISGVILMKGALDFLLLSERETSH